MPPFAGALLAAVHLKDTVDAMMGVLDAGESVNVQDVSTPLTNGVLLDLYRCALASKESVGPRLVALLHGLGYIAVADRLAERKWVCAAKRTYDMCVTKKAKFPKGVKKFEFLARVRADCSQSKRTENSHGGTAEDPEVIAEPLDATTGEPETQVCLFLVYLCVQSVDIFCSFRWTLLTLGSQVWLTIRYNMLLIWFVPSSCANLVSV